MKNKKLALIFFLTIFLSYTYQSDADEGMMYNQNLHFLSDVHDNPLANLVYQDKSFELAYKSFVFAGNVEDAYALSYSAVKQNPQSLIWRERLIQTSLWSNHLDTALTQMLYLIKEKNKLAYLPKAINIAQKAHRYEMLISLLEFAYTHDSQNVKLISELADAYADIGDTTYAIQFLQQENARQANEIFLTQLQKIYHGIGAVRDELAVLYNKEKQYGLTVKLALAIAAIHYSQASPMLALMKLKAVSQKEQIRDQTFWETMASLAWLVGDEQATRQAYLTLYQLRALHNEVGFEHLLAVQPKGAETQTLPIAMTAWQRFHQPGFFLESVNLAVHLQAWETLRKLYEMKMPIAKRNNLETLPEYWEGLTLLLTYDGKAQWARQLVLNAVLQQPANDKLKLFYLNFLLRQLYLFIPEQQPAYLLAALPAWQNKVLYSHAWASIYVRALILLDETDRALTVYQYQANSPSKEPEWNNGYAGLLDEFSFAKSAHEARKAYWLYIQREIVEHEVADIDFWSVYADLASHFFPGQISYPLAVQLAAQNQLNAADQLLSWAIAHKNAELTAYLIAYYYPHAAPAYAVLGLALMRNDQPTLRQLITTMSKVLPRKDRTTAAEQLGDRSLTQQFAYEAASHSHDAERYAQMVEAMLKTANQFDVATEFEQFGALQGPRALAKLKYFIDNSWYVAPYASIWDSQTNNTGNLASHSYMEKIAGIIFARDTDRYHLYFDVGDHDALFNSYNAEITADYVITSQLNVEAVLGYNRRSTLSTYMLIAGSQDEARLIANYTLTPRDKLIGLFEFDNYYLQDRTALGNGKIFTGEIDHKFWLEYPDFTLALIGSIDRFARFNPLYQGRVLSIFPLNILPSTSAFISENFWQTEIMFSFGDEPRNNYTHTWRPYANVGYLYNSVANFGPDIDIGIAGSVLGRDKLAMYYTRTTTTTGTSQSNFLLGLRYQIYF